MCISCKRKPSLETFHSLLLRKSQAALKGFKENNNNENFVFAPITYCKLIFSLSESKCSRCDRLGENLFRLSLLQKRNDIPEEECGLSADRVLLKRIIGGNEAKFGQFPWQAHLKIAAYQCGGVLGKNCNCCVINFHCCGFFGQKFRQRKSTATGFRCAILKLSNDSRTRTMRISKLELLS